MPRLLRSLAAALLVLAPCISARAQRPAGARPRTPSRALVAGDTGGPIRIAGRVTIGTGTISHSRLQIYVQTSTRGWLVFNDTGGTAVTIGDSVEATGTRAAYRGMPEVFGATVRVVPSFKATTDPKPLTFDQAPRHLGELVAMRGVVSRTWPQIGNPSVEIIPEGAKSRGDSTSVQPASITLFEFAEGTVPIDFASLHLGDRVAVTGVLSRRDDIGGVHVYVLLPRSSADLRIMGWSASRKRMLGVVALAVLFVGGIAAAWIFVLRREVGVQAVARRESESRYAQIFDESPAGNFVSTPDGRLLACNARFASLFGFASAEEACRANTKSLYPDPSAHAAMIAALRRDGHVAGMDIELRGVDGAPRFVQENVVGQFDQDGELVELHGFLLDTSERRRLESEFRQAQKMESIGRLAGGVAHDFNNLLTVIVAASDLALESQESGQSPRDDLLEIRHAAQRGVDLTRQLLAFSRRQVLKPALNDVSAVVAGLGSLLRRLVGETISIAITLPESPRHATLVDASQLEQTIINLAVNAADAMPNGGTLRIEVAEVRFDGQFVATHEGSREGNYCCVRVIDTGVGMDDVTLSRAFEPFFTTKAVGKGTGLGLSMVFGFVKQSEGYVLMNSAQNEGTTVSLYLPLVDEPVPDTHPVRPQAALPAARAVPPRGTALVVEDEPQVRNIAARILRGLGFDVVEAADAAQAAALSRTLASLTLVLTDVVMPNGGGAEVERHVRALFPGVPLVFMSGYTNDNLILEGIRKSRHAFLEKPFTPESLTEKVLSVAADVPAVRKGRAV